MAATAITATLENPKRGRRLSDEEVYEFRDRAGDMAVEMEAGDYLDTEGERWPARPFVTSEILRRLGYSPTKIAKSEYPRWWPGQRNFRRLVDWKKELRRFEGRAAINGVNPKFGPLIDLAIDRMGFRLAVTPDDVSSRDIVDLIAKLSRMYQDIPAEPPSGAQASGGVVFRRITEEITALPEGPARARLERRYKSIIDQAQQAIPATATPVE